MVRLVVLTTPNAYLIDEQGILVGDAAVGIDSILALLAGARSPGIHEVARMA
jgi:hypothetical protein